MNLRSLRSYEVGLLVAGAVLLGLCAVALLWRLLSIVLNPDFATVTLGLAVVAGAGAWFLDWASDLVARRRSEAQIRAAEERQR